MDHAAMFMMMLTGPMIATIVVSTNAKKLNAAWHERRAVKLADRT